MTRPRCTVDGCERPVQARGYCGSHYMAWQRGKPFITDSDRQQALADITARAQAEYRAGNTVVEVAAKLGIGHVRARRLIGDLFDPAQANRLRAKASAAYQANLNRPPKTPKPRSVVVSQAGRKPATRFDLDVSPKIQPPFVRRYVPHVDLGRYVPHVDLGLAPCAPIRWDPTATPERQAMLATAAIHRCTGDRRAAARMLGITFDTLMAAMSTARRLGLAA